MKQCLECLKFKPETDFYKKTTNTERQHYMSWCKTCHGIRRSARTLSNKARAVEYMGGKCQLCSYDRCIQALEFHHVDPSLKDGGLNNIKCWGWDRIVRELEKCVMLCANCHREVENGVVESPPREVVCTRLSTLIQGLKSCL